MHRLSLFSTAQTHVQIGVRLVSDSKLTLGVNVSVTGCLSLCVGSAMDLPSVYTISHPISTGIGSSFPCEVVYCRNVHDVP